MELEEHMYDDIPGDIDEDFNLMLRWFKHHIAKNKAVEKLFSLIKFTIVR